MFQPFASLAKSPLKRCNVAPASVRLSTLTPSETGIGSRCDPAKVVGKGLDGGERPAALRLRQRQDAVEIDLRRRQHAGEAGDGAEIEQRIAAQPDRALVGAVLELDLLDHRARAVAVDLSGQAPGFEDLGLRSGRRPRERTRERHAADEARRAVLDRDEALGVGGQRPVDGIDIEPHAHAIVADAARRDAIGIVLAVGIERSLPLDRPDSVRSSPLNSSLSSTTP